VTTSIITPPLSVWASPVLTFQVPFSINFHYTAAPVKSQMSN
jgi:hypothetical protein